MNDSLNKILRNHGVKVTLYLIISLILIDTFLTYRYKLALNDNIEIQNKLDAIAARKATILADLNNLDMSLRGYLLVQNEAFLGTFDKMKNQNGPTMRYLETQLPGIGIPATSLADMNKM